jgi:hypothetical protein
MPAAPRKVQPDMHTGRGGRSGRGGRGGRGGLGGAPNNSSNRRNSKAIARRNELRSRYHEEMERNQRLNLKEREVHGEVVRPDDQFAEHDTWWDRTMRKMITPCQDNMCCMMCLMCCHVCYKRHAPRPHGHRHIKEYYYPEVEADIEKKSKRGKHRCDFCSDGRVIHQQSIGEFDDIGRCSECYGELIYTSHFISSISLSHFT